MFCCVILAMQYKVALMTSLWTWIHVVVWFLSIAGILISNFISYMTFHYFL